MSGLNNIPVRKLRAMNEIYSVQDVIKKLGLFSIKTIHYRIRHGLLPTRIKIGGRYYWLKCQVAELKEAFLKPLPQRRYPYIARKLTPKQMKKLLKLREQGWSQPQLAKKFPLSQSQICRMLRQVKEQQNATN